MINEHPDVLVVQNPNVTLLAKELKRAMEAGIYVVQVNMASNTLSDAYVGVDARDMGRRLAHNIIDDCGGGKGSGEVSILEGEATAAYSLDMKNGALEVFKTDPTIKVVSSQPTSWDANKAGEITTTVLQQHPDLCAILASGVRRRRARRRPSRPPARPTRRRFMSPATASPPTAICSSRGSSIAIFPIARTRRARRSSTP